MTSLVMAMPLSSITSMETIGAPGAAPAYAAADAGGDGRDERSVAAAVAGRVRLEGRHVLLRPDGLTRSRSRERFASMPESMIAIAGMLR